MSYSQLQKRRSPHHCSSKSPLKPAQFSNNDQKFYQELTQKLWDTKPADENTHPDVQQLRTKRANNYLTDENNLLQENRKLKELIIQMKLQMKSKQEEDLLKQKNEFQQVLQEYKDFIEKILADKKDLQLKLELLEHQESSLQQENEKSLKQSEEFNSKLNQIEQLLAQLETEKCQAHEKIETLKQQNNSLKLHYEKEILQLKEQNCQDFQKFESIVQIALQKKDDKIRKLKEQLLQYQSYQ